MWQDGVGSDGEWELASFYLFNEELRTFVSAGFIDQFLQLLLKGSAWKRDPVNNIGNRQVSANQLQIVLNGALAKYTLKDASNEINHHSVVLLLQNLCKLGEDDHPIIPHAQLRSLRDRSALLLDVLPEFCDQREHRVVQDMARDVIMSLFLIPDVNQAVVNPHLELCRRFKLPTLVLIEFLQALEGYGKRSSRHGRKNLTILTIHQESVFLSHKGWFSAEEMNREDMVPSATVVTLDSERPSLVLHGKIGSNGS